MIKPRHDQLFRKALENPIVAHELLATHLPQDVFSLIDISTLKLEKESFIESDLSNSISDVLFSAKFSDNDGYIHLLLEHQSRPDHFMAFRLFKYMMSICDRHLRNNPKAKQLPLVYPMVIYNGKRDYKVARNIWKLFSNEIKAKKFWIEDHKLVNVRDIPDEELKKRAWSGILEFFLKHIHERNLLARWQEVKDLIPELIKIRVGYDYLGAVLSYTLTYIDEKDMMELKKMLTESINQEEGGEVMVSIAESWLNEGIEIGKREGRSIAEAWWQEGKQEGRQEGRQEGLQDGRQEGIEVGVAQGEERKAIEIAKKMLLKGMPPSLVASITGLREKFIISNIIANNDSSK